MTWQPGSTAPKDGSYFLAKDKDGNVAISEYFKLYHDKYELQENGLYAKETVCYHEGFSFNNFVEWHEIPPDNNKISEDITDSNIVEHLQNFAQSSTSLRCQVEEYAANRILQLESVIREVIIPLDNMEYETLLQECINKLDSVLSKPT